MTEPDPRAFARTKPTQLTGTEAGKPDIRRRRFSAIWLLPIVALLAAAWLGYTTFASRGPTITITFVRASGLEPGKTPIRYHDIELGIVNRIQPSPDLSHIIVSAEMNRTAEPHLTEGTNFWIVRPRLGITSFSGLETLVSGNYIEMDPARSGKEKRDFTGLEEPPVVRSDEPGTSYIVASDKIGSISSGSPVFTRGIAVGEVIGYSFTGQEKKIPIRLFVKKPYDALIREGTQFWNASGISVSAGGGGFKFQVESLEAVLAGGIAFDTPEAALDTALAKADNVFPLYDDRSAAVEAGYKARVRALVEFEGSVRGLDVGAPVELMGIPIGSVVDVKLVVDAAKRDVRVPVVIEIDIGRVGIVNLPPGELGNRRLINGLVARGLRAQLRSSSLLTGSLLVALDFFPDAPPAEIQETDTYPQLPTVPGQMEGLTRSVGRVLDKLAALPVDELAADMRNTLDSATKLLRDANTGSAPLLASLRQTSDAANIVLKSLGDSYGSGSQIPRDLSVLLRQLQDAVRSIDRLATYLEQHPESLVRGKAPPQ